jgi:prepilin-type N-terminal cleavage/methylation domain-containing protein
MLTRINKPREDRDAGFTLIELLVVVAIIGILAAIAIPVFLSQRAGARDASVKADLNGIAKVMETIYTSGNAYPLVYFNADATPPAVGLESESPVTSPGNYLEIEVLSDNTGFMIRGCNAESGNLFQYASDAGGLVATAVADDYDCPGTAGAVQTQDTTNGIPIEAVTSFSAVPTA